MTLKYIGKQYIAFGKELARKARAAGFTWDDRGAHVTDCEYRALQLFDHAEGEAFQRLLPLYCEIEDSYETVSEISIPVPPGLAYRSYQIAGIKYMSRYRISLNGDEMGLGKTIQAIGLANLDKAKRILIICPAHLKEAWKRELKKWLKVQMPISSINSGNDIVNPDIPVVLISYNLAVDFYHALIDVDFDLIVCDECQYLKNISSQRSTTILGGISNEIKIKGIITRGKRVSLLSGTPVNNRAAEFYSIIRSCAPQILNYVGPSGKAQKMKRFAFERRFHTFGKGFKQPKITGSKNEFELHNRLRSGFMVRRLKKDVLKELPAKQYNLVVFPQDSATARVIKKEKPFDAVEIYQNGVPVGSGLPEIRHEMGLAMVPKAISWVKDMLESIEKLLIFVHHRDVLYNVAEGLSIYHPAIIIGGKSVKNKQQSVDRFQEDETCRLMIANQAGGTGYTMTAAHNVALFEPSWVPADNDQYIDRAHRIGQLNMVNVHLLCVEGSIGAHILGTAAKKWSHLNKIYGGNDENEH
jgi:SWI/SNF-related matrix-associated actin-dependent regulator 1 of chromatin subfamily A